MRVLGVDYGQKRSGLAIGDSVSRLVFPYRTVSMRGMTAFLSELLAIAAAERTQAFVFGLPLRRDGSCGPNALKVREAARLLGQLSPLPVFFMDEWLSSYEAGLRLRETGQTPGKIKQHIDQVAAMLILESFFALPEQQSPGGAADTLPGES